MTNELTIADRLAYAFTQYTNARNYLAAIALAVGANGYNVSQRGVILTPYIEDLQHIEGKIDAFVRAHGGKVRARRNSFSLGRACDSRCTTAKGDTCVCSCDGTNHGSERHLLAFAGLPTAPQVPAMAPLVAQERVHDDNQPEIDAANREALQTPVAPVRTYAPTPAHGFDADALEWAEPTREELGDDAVAYYERVDAAARRAENLARAEATRAAVAAVPYAKTSRGARALAWKGRR